MMTNTWIGDILHPVDVRGLLQTETSEFCLFVMYACLSASFLFNSSDCQIFGNKEI